MRRGTGATCAKELVIPQSAKMSKSVPQPEPTLRNGSRASHQSRSRLYHGFGGSDSGSGGGTGGGM